MVVTHDDDHDDDSNDEDDDDVNVLSLFGDQTWSQFGNYCFSK